MNGGGPVGPIGPVGPGGPVTGGGPGGGVTVPGDSIVVGGPGGPGTSTSGTVLRSARRASFALGAYSDQFPGFSAMTPGVRRQLGFLGGLGNPYRRESPPLHEVYRGDVWRGFDPRRLVGYRRPRVSYVIR